MGLHFRGSGDRAPPPIDYSHNFHSFQAPVEVASYQWTFSPSGGSSSPPQQQVLAGTSNWLYDDLQLTPQANNVLAPLFKNNFDFDISKVTFKFGWTGVAHAITISNTVTLNQGKWNKLTPGQQRKLLAHEVTHAVQYERLNPGGGVFRGVGLPMAIMSFLGRYTPSYIILSHKDNYVPDVDLKREPLSTLDVLDTRWTLDQIAEHVADQVQ